MLLCDQIIFAAANKDRPDRLGIGRRIADLPVVRDQLDHLCGTAADLKEAKLRFVLSDEVIGAAMHLLLSKPMSMTACVRALRIFAPCLWIEWLEAPRLAIRKELGITEPNGKDIPHRVGFLVRTDAEGRRGTVELAWHHALGDDQVPQVCPMLMEFDFDRLDDESVVGSVAEGSDLLRRWAGHPGEIAALKMLDRTATEKWSALGRKSAESFAATLTNLRPADRFRSVENSIYDDLSGEFLNALAMILLLSTKNGTESRAEDRTKLNKARAKRGEPPLLDHVTAYLKLSKAERAAGIRHGDGGVTGGRRPHMVRGHTVVRGRQIFWRRAHMRCLDSDVAAATKTIKVSL